MYRQISTGEYPFRQREIRNLFPNTSFPNPFRADDFEWVFPVPKPALTDLQVANETTPVKDGNNNWIQVWVIADKFSDITGGPTKIEQDKAHLYKLQQQVNKQAVTAKKQAVTDDVLYTKLKSIPDTDAFIENSDEATRLKILKLLVKKIIT